MEKFAYTDTETLLWDYSETEEHYVLVIPPARRVRTLYRVTQVYAYQWFGLNGGNNLKIIYYPFAQTHFRNLTNPCDCPPESVDILASISVDPSSVLEDSGTPMIYTVTLDIASLYDTTVNFTLTGTATEGVDYTAVTHSVTITAGQTTGTFAIHPISDSSFEPDETVIATLTTGTSGVNVVVISTTNYSATGTIVNDDIVPPSAWQQPLSVPLLVGYGFGGADASSYSENWLRALTSCIPTTWNSLDKSSNIVLSNGNLTATDSSSGDMAVRAVASHGPSSGKYYIEFTIGSTYAGGDTGPGFCTAAAPLNSVGVVALAGVIVYPSGNIYFNGSITAKAIGALTTGTVVGMAIDLGNNKIWMRKDGGDWYTDVAANPATNTNGLDISAVFASNPAYPVFAANSNGSFLTANFGAAVYAFAAPSGFGVWCGDSAGCAGFTIPTTAGLVAWIDACVASSFVLSVGVVQTAVDQSPNGYVFTSGVVGPNYLATGFNSRPTIQFSDSATFQSLNYPTAALGTGNTLTIFAAATLGPDLVNGFHSSGRLMSYTAAAAGHDYDNDGSFALFRDASTDKIAFDRTSVTAPSVSVSYDTKRRIIFTLKSDGTRTLYIDGVATSTAGAVANFVSPGYLSMGGSKVDSGFFSGNYSGLISEWGVYSTYTDVAGVLLLDTYLKNKWGMSATAPLGAMVGWYDSSVFSSLTLSGSTITGVTDLSGSGNHLVTAGGVSTPAPTYSAAGFNTSYPTMAFTPSAPSVLALAPLIRSSFSMGVGNTLTFFFVGTVSSSSQSNTRVLSYGTGGSHDYNNAGSWLVGRNSAAAQSLFLRNGTQLNPAYVYDTPTIFIGTIDSGGTMTLYTNGVASSTVVSAGNWVNNGTFGLGGGVYDFDSTLQGKISEAGISTNFTNSSDVAVLYATLKAKWGL